MSARSSYAALFTVISVVLAACVGASPPPSPTDSSAMVMGSNAPPVTTTATTATTMATVTAAASASVASPANSAMASATTSASSAPASTAEAALPNIKVTNIGMHIGGGKNDSFEKDPIRKSVEPHFDLFKRCFAMVEDPKLPLDVSTDLFIDRAGGKPKVKKMSTASKSKPFQECVSQSFESIDFLKPSTGTTNVSYALRFSK